MLGLLDVSGTLLEPRAQPRSLSVGVQTFKAIITSTKTTPDTKFERRVTYGTPHHMLWSFTKRWSRDNVGQSINRYWYLRKSKAQLFLLRLLWYTMHSMTIHITIDFGVFKEALSFNLILSSLVGKVDDPSPVLHVRMTRWNYNINWNFLYLRRNERMAQPTKHGEMILD